MRNRWSLVTVLTVVVSLCVADLAQAQLFRRGRGGYGGYGGYGYSYPSYGYYNDGYYGSGYYNPGGWNYGYNNWNNGWNNWNDGNYMGQGFRAYYPSNDGDDPSRAGNAGQRDQRAFILVRLPNADAQVWFGDHRTQQRGTQRMFESPSLQPGTYSYQVKAKWRQGDKDMNQTRTVTVHPGQEVRVDFTRSGSSQGEQLNNQPNRQNQGNQSQGNQNRNNRNSQNRNNQDNENQQNPPQ